MPSKRSQLKRTERPRPLTHLLCAAVLLLALLMAGGRAPLLAADGGPTAVDLLYFRGESGDNAAHLEWETGTEADTAGFRLERATTASGSYATLDEIGLIPARGSVSAGAAYEATDETALNGQSYWYRLVELTADNSVGGSWTVRVDVAAEPTAVVIGGGETQATATPVPTSTTRPTATSRSATNTPQATATRSASDDGGATPTATNTPRPTSTRRPAASPTSASSSAVPTRATLATAPAGAAGSLGVEVTSLPATAVAQAYPGAPTSTPGAYAPPPDTPQADSAGSEGVRAVEAASGDAAVTPPGGGRSIGAGDAGDAAAPAADGAQQEEKGSSSLLLWLGFLAALFIFGGGIVFSIYLSTRKRSNDLP